MAICYLAALAVVLIPWLHRNGRLSLLILTNVFLLISVILSVAFPVFILPEPSGRFPVGSSVFMLEDTTREEIFTEESTDFRKIAVKAWYPTDSAQGKGEPYWNGNAIGEAIAESEGYPRFLLSHLHLVKTKTRADSPLSKAMEKYPVLIFSHGYLMYAGQSRILMEELASHGYIVLSISHTYEASATVFPDGSVITYKKEVADLPPEILQAAGELWNLSKQATSKEDKKKYIGQLYDLTEIYDYQDIKTWVDDTVFLLDQLDEGDIPFFSGRTDMSKIGVFGHSYGGSTAAEACIEDDRIKAGINFDGIPHGNLLKGVNLDKPFMVFISELGKDPHQLDLFSDQYTKEKHLYFIKGSSHLDFSDMPYFTPLARYLGASGINKKEDVQKLVNKYTLAFFNKYLLGMDNDFLRETTKSERID